MELLPAELAVISGQLHELNHPLDDLLALYLECLTGACKRGKVDALKLRHLQTREIGVIQLLKHVDGHKARVYIY